MQSVPFLAMAIDAGSSSVYLGQFEDETAEEIAAALEEAGIGWYYKQPGGITRLMFAGEWGVRLFVDAARIDEVRTIVERVTTADQGEN